MGTDEGILLPSKGRRPMYAESTASLEGCPASCQPAGWSSTISPWACQIGLKWPPLVGRRRRQQDRRGRRQGELYQLNVGHKSAQDPGTEDGRRAGRVASILQTADEGILLPSKGRRPMYAESTAYIAEASERRSQARLGNPHPDR